MGVVDNVPIPPFKPTTVESPSLNSKKIYNLYMDANYDSHDAFQNNHPVRGGCFVERLWQERAYWRELRRN